VEVLEMLAEKQAIVKSIVRRKKNWIGLDERRRLLREFMEGRMEGRGREVKKK